MNKRTVAGMITSKLVSDGAGVKLRRSLGQTQQHRLDPFLMLDEFSSDNPDDYIAGFPPHPHRGFETVTYMLVGHMLHEDHLGNKGHLRDGDVQWMTAARGIIHSEMPQQVAGQLHGFQLWINLPANEKMKPAAYRDIPAAQIPQLQTANGVLVKVIAGTVTEQDHAITGPVQGMTTQPLLVDVQLPAGAVFTHTLPVQHNAFVYLYQGSVQIGEYLAVTPHTALMLSAGDTISVTAVTAARFLLLAAKPLQEPIVQYGPFVMNTREEIEQAVSDYNNGKLTA